jgi:NAD-dependent DNA ligase
MALTATQLCLAHRYLYYCLCESVISDSDYDRLESAALRESEDSPLSLPGSDNPKSYSQETIDLALTMLRNKKRGELWEKQHQQWKKDGLI